MGGHEGGVSTSGGVRVFSIGGRMVNQRERLLGMTDEERRWRAQFLKDQVLAPNEPRFCPELYKATNNIFVRLFRTPMNLVEKAVTPVLGEERAFTFRFLTGKLISTYIAALCITYYFKYNEHDWTKTKGNWYLVKEKPNQVPGDPGFPIIVKKEKHEYADLGFSKSPFW